MSNDESPKPSTRARKTTTPPSDAGNETPKPTATRKATVNPSNIVESLLEQHQKLQAQISEATELVKQEIAETEAIVAEKEKALLMPEILRLALLHSTLFAGLTHSMPRPEQAAATLIPLPSDPEVAPHAIAPELAEVLSIEVMAIDDPSPVEQIDHAVSLPSAPEILSPDTVEEIGDASPPESPPDVATTEPPAPAPEQTGSDSPIDTILLAGIQKIERRRPKPEPELEPEPEPELEPEPEPEPELEPSEEEYGGWGFDDETEDEDDAQAALEEADSLLAMLGEATTVSPPTIDWDDIDEVVTTPSAPPKKGKPVAKATSWLDDDELLTEAASDNSSQGITNWLDDF
jgi:hypothetical protein